MATDQPDPKVVAESMAAIKEGRTRPIQAATDSQLGSDVDAVSAFDLLVWAESQGWCGSAATYVLDWTELQGWCSCVSRIPGRPKQCRFWRDNWGPHERKRKGISAEGNTAGQAIGRAFCAVFGLEYETL